ncbi:hypothetical protein FRB91_002542 [Serendipita sp. 411]|nr:hypothetical protein FRB91_002542 [Serendipita sp. 411]
MISIRNIIPQQLRAMTWSLSPTLSPLLVLAGIQGIIYIYDPLSKERVSVLRGHGGRITSVTAHPRKPHIICTTSRDHTMRLWDLHLPKPMKVVAADPEAARLGPPFGNPLTGGEEEGIGPGKCFAVSAGGVGDGHKATVLDASLHPFLNIVATSSVDHAVMLWMYEPPPSPTASVCTLAIIGRPVFCFKRFHMAQVIRVHWLSPSVLLSQTSQSFSAGHDNFPGKLVVWEWLHYEALKEAAENGVKYARDYLNSTDSSSYKILAEVHIRQPTAMPLSISGTMATLTTSSIIRVIDLSLLIARARPDPDVALLHRDLSLEHEEEWQEKLREIKRQQWESAGNLWFPGVVDAVEIVNQNLEKTYNAVLYHGILIRVGERERVQVWLPSEALSH